MKLFKEEFLTLIGETLYLKHLNVAIKEIIVQKNIIKINCMKKV